MIDTLYPKSPTVNAAEITGISAAYRKQVVKVLFSISLFIVSYLGVLIASVVFFGLCLFLTAAALSYVRHWIVLLLIGGVLVMGCMLLYFLVKFLFQKKPEESNDRIEIKQNDAPILFDFIQKLCTEVGTALPKKVVISPSVNAAVYYDLSFVSLLFPARKNLEIGAGLLNSINLSEFKAVLAHEFGHFSQSSTKLGSYVYRVRLVLHNLIYQNDGWLETLQQASSVHAVISAFGAITIWLAKGIMSLFTSVFKVIDINYMALSREMEFHADAVAVSVTGSKSIIAALRRIDVGEEVFQLTVARIRQFDGEKAVIPENFFELHSYYLKQYATDHNLPLENGIPLVAEDLTIDQEIKGRLDVENIFSTHPPIEAREQNAQSFNVPSVNVPESPWQLFSNPKHLQVALSKLIEALKIERTETIDASNEEIISKSENEDSENRLHPMIQDYFQLTSNIADKPDTSSQAHTEVNNLAIDDLFGKKITNRIKRYFLTVQEEQTMLSISSGNLPIKKFVFDGTLRTRYHSREIYEQIKADNEAEVEELKKHNQLISNWFYFKMLDKDPVLAKDYLTNMEFYQVMAKDCSSGNAIRVELETFYAEHIQVYRDVDDIPYQRKKIIELFEKWNAWRIAVPQRDIPSLFNPVFTDPYRRYFMKVEVDNPDNMEHLGGLAEFHRSIVEQLELLSAKQNEMAVLLVKKQNEFIGYLTDEKSAKVISE